MGEIEIWLTSYKTALNEIKKTLLRDTPGIPKAIIDKIETLEGLVETNLQTVISASSEELPEMLEE